jgi:dipeptidyl aminopeptidase/acylaminoacyl peptidase
MFRKKSIYFTLISLSCCFTSLAQQTLTPELLWKLRRLSGGQVSPDGKQILFEVRTFDVPANSGNTDLFVYNLQKGDYRQITQTPFSEMEAQWGKNNAIWYLSTEKDGVQLWKMAADGTGKQQVSAITDREIEGYKLSHNEKQVLFICPVKSGQTLAEKYTDLPLANARETEDLMYRHWNQWSDYQKRHLFLYALQNNRTADSGTDLLASEDVNGLLPPFGGSDQIAFSPDDQQIVYSCKKKNGKAFALSTNSELYQYTISTQQTQVLSTSSGYDANPRYSADGKLAWLSMARDGFEADKNDIILRVGGKDKNLTAAMDITVDEFCFSRDQKMIYFIAPFKGIKQIFSVHLAKGTIQQLTESAFDHVSLDVTTDDALIAGRQSMTMPTELYSIHPASGKAKALTHLNAEILKDIELPTVQERWVETTDGQKMLVWVVLPPNFDASKKYPALLYCQGGPQSMVSQSFSYRWNLALMASNGYIVIAPNRRGLPGFGQKWNDAISKDWGGQAMKDYLTAVDNLSTEPYVDEKRLGAVGASYGGYSVYYLAGIHQNRFKTFIAHCGLFNLESWYGTTEELFFANWDNKGPYWLPENKAYYAQNSPHNFVQNWNTPILVIHGGMDFRVPEGEGMQAFQAAQLKGLRSKYLLFPKEGHWISTPQNGILWYREFFAWLDTDLKQ